MLSPLLETQSRGIASRLPARSVLQNASHFEVSTGDPHPSGHLQFSAHDGTKAVKMQFNTDAQKIQNEAHALITTSTELPFDAENPKTEIHIFRFFA